MTDRDLITILRRIEAKLDTVIQLLANRGSQADKIRLELLLRRDDVDRDSVM